MKRIFALFLTCMLLLTACGEKSPAENSRTNSEEAPPAAETADTVDSAEATTMTLRIVDGAESGELLLAGENASDVYTVSTKGVPILLDGGSASAEDLKDGMLVDIHYTGGIAESFPGQPGGVDSISASSIGTEECPGGGYFDLCGFYLKVLNDLWEKDPAMNEGISTVSVDLSQAPGDLTNGEKEAIAWVFAQEHQVEELTYSWEQLKKEGYLTEETAAESDPAQEPQDTWEDGLFFSITSHETEEEETYSLPVLRFDAQKYTDLQNVCGFTDCTAVWPEMGTWTDYQVRAEN